VRLRALIALALVGALAGCQESGFDESRETQRPLKVQHAMDELTGTKVPGVAERPMTLGADALGDTVALGVTPVRASLAGRIVPPFLREEAGGVELVPRVTELDLAAADALQPDVILGAKEFHGDLYDDLSRIAPTVMTEGRDWKLNLRLHGEALGRTNDAERLLIDWDNRVARVKRLVGERDVSVTFSVTPPDVREFDTGPDSFATLLLEELGIEEGRDGDVRIHVRAGQEWVGLGGLAGARDALADVERAL
jgi:iron complex transport system substrate-binding protein